MSLESKIGLGTVQFGVPYGISNTSGQTSKEEVTKILNFAQNHGISVLDTASAYGNAEEILGNNHIKGFKIVSKFMPPANGESINQQLSKSLEKLQCQSLYGYLAHQPSNVVENPSQWDELKELKYKGLINKIGFSLYEPDELITILDQDFVPDLIQVPFNYFDRRFEKLLIELKQTGCEIHSRSAFLQGLFFMNVNNLNSFFSPVKENIRRLQDENNNLAGSLLGFVVSQNFIDKVIIGVETTEQLRIDLTQLEETTMLPDLQTIIPADILIPSRWPTN
jgi:aryl-alcohol dehydrogenase-like predicted oxidoreductase